MGYSPTGNKPAGKCQDGTAALFAYVRQQFQTGNLGCLNPASTVPGGGMSLHAEGRAFDAALNANDPVQRARGDALLHWLVDNHEALGTQEVLWRGFIWSYQRRGEGIRSGVQQSAHMNHVHCGQDWDAALHWTTDRLPGTPGGVLNIGGLTVADLTKDELAGWFQEQAKSLRDHIDGREDDTRKYVAMAVENSTRQILKALKEKG